MSLIYFLVTPPELPCKFIHLIAYRLREDEGLHDVRGEGQDY